MDVMDTIKDLRKALGEISQEQLARMLDVTLRTVARYENDAPPKGYMLVRLSGLADNAGEHGLRDKFLDAYIDEILDALDLNIAVAFLKRLKRITKNRYLNS